MNSWCISQHLPLQHKAFRAHTLYSMVDGFRQGIFWLVGKKKIENKMWAHCQRQVAFFSGQT